METTQEIKNQRCSASYNYSGNDDDKYVADDDDEDDYDRYE